MPIKRFATITNRINCWKFEERTHHDYPYSALLTSLLFIFLVYEQLLF